MKCLLRITGPFISKKNEWCIRSRWIADSAGRRKMLRYIGLNESAQAKVDESTRQLTLQWAGILRRLGRRVSLRHPRILWKLGLENPAKDKDGVRTTLLDCMQDAGVIYDDNVRHLNGWEHAAPAVIVEGGEWAEIYLDWETKNECEVRKPKRRPGGSDRRRRATRGGFRRR